MSKRVFLFFISFQVFLTAISQEKLLTAGMKITTSSRIKKSIYKLDAPVDTSQSVVLIEGNNITVDFNTAEMKGSNGTINPDEFFGVAVIIRNCKNVTIKNLKARSYKIALLARNVEKLTLENCDFSYNYRQHLNSTQEKEDVSDWLSHHRNENDEWLRYGAAMYLKDCNNFIVRNCKVTGGQNALMIMRCNDGLIVNNDFSFNSGIGIGMYRSNRNRIIYNRLIFNIRGYSDGVYNRGQDSAGILVYEQSNDNIFYRNIATHGGDGFFLWAGQTTMDTGEGGCNDNVIYGNDFSYASNNGIEATFSRNKIVNNRMIECDYGVWAGYSYQTIFGKNYFQDNRTAIAIEHGQENKLFFNSFQKNKMSVRLWANKKQPAGWGYAAKRDTRSRDYVLYNNLLYNCNNTYDIKLTDNIKICDLIQECKDSFLPDSSVTNFTRSCKTMPQFKSEDTSVYLPRIKNYKDSFRKFPKYDGRKNIMITEWGPYDFRSPIIWNTNPTDTSSIMKFNLIGPKGKWQIKNIKGVKNISASSGTFPANITAEKTKGERTDILIELEYTGSAITTVFGEKISAGKPYKFQFRKFFQPIDWEVLFYSLDTTYHNPITTGMLFSMTERKAPFRTEKTNKLDYAWWGGIKETGVQHRQFITSANGSARFLPDNYELSVTWDDAVRVYVDEKLVIDEWNPSRYSFDESPNKKVRLRLGGNHNFRVEHVELGGFATLSLKIKPVE
ncbi:MAG: right-handed parallel beta-helix repeat-containing protein [Sphingobacteriales bacterium]|nr:right-handed parallel beta-helix repeat-containing protein [Sphingobacteriales bacterium]